MKLDVDFNSHTGEKSVIQNGLPVRYADGFTGVAKPAVCDGHDVQQMFNNYRNCAVAFRGAPTESTMGVSTNSSEILIFMATRSKGQLKYPYISFSFRTDCSSSNSSSPAKY